METLASLETLAALKSRDLQREATKLGIKNSRDYSKEDLLEKCKTALAIKASEQKAKEEVEASIEIKKPVIKVASISTPLPMASETKETAETITTPKVKKAKKVKAEKVEIEYHEMERGDFLQHYPSKKPFPLSTPLLSVFAKKDKETGKLMTWLENSKGEMIGDVEHSYMRTYRRAIAIRKTEASYSNHKVVVYFEFGVEA